MQTLARTLPPGDPGAKERLVYLVHPSALVAADIAGQLRHFGYEVAVVGDITQLESRVAAKLPDAVVIDVGTPAAIFPVADEVARLRGQHGRRFAVIFISARGNFASRLAAARAGASGYFSGPLNMIALRERLDALTVHEELAPYRVLVIHGDPRAADDYPAVLIEAGMEVSVLGRVADMLQVLGDFRPELVLMDVQTPQYDGADLAKLIRQDDTYLDVPIIFLSDEAGIAKHMSAIESGGDDFLAKPVQPLNLISLLASRAERYRALRGLITRDGLTGLLNHSALKEQLGREIVRARRERSPLTLAMIDIDFFKRVNDTYGHPVGDQVIRALSRLLQQRLRRGDVVGRYGGEEFAVIMPATTSAAGQHVLDGIRETFSDIRHYADEKAFTATFSAGVAELATSLDAEALFAVADSALYNAKHKGRNRVEAGEGSVSSAACSSIDPPQSPYAGSRVPA